MLLHGLWPGFCFFLLSLFPTEYVWMSLLCLSHSFYSVLGNFRLIILIFSIVLTNPLEFFFLSVFLFIFEVLLILENDCC